jgi:hypothetical protein
MSKLPVYKTSHARRSVELKPSISERVARPADKPTPVLHRRETLALIDASQRAHTTAVSHPKECVDQQVLAPSHRQTAETHQTRGERRVARTATAMAEPLAQCPRLERPDGDLPLTWLWRNSNGLTEELNRQMAILHSFVVTGPCYCASPPTS